MEEERSHLSQLFCPVKNKPMQFAIVLQNILNVECERVLRHIEDKGGEFMGFDPEDSEYIVLASTKYKPPPNQIVFDVKYVKRCVKEKKLLDLRDFQLSGEKMSGPRCFSFQKIVEEDRCRHFQTAEQVLKKIKSLKAPRETPKPERSSYGRQEMILDREQKIYCTRKIDVARAHLVIKKRLARLEAEK